MVFRLLYQKILFFLSFLLSCKYYFFIFFLFPDFSSISLLLFYQFWTKLIFWKIILGSILWLVHNVSPLYKLEGNNWSKCNNSSSVHKNCLMFMNMTYSYQFFYFLLFYIVFCKQILFFTIFRTSFNIYLKKKIFVTNFPFVAISP